MCGPLCPKLAEVGERLVAIRAYYASDPVAVCIGNPSAFDSRGHHLKRRFPGMLCTGMKPVPPRASEPFSTMAWMCGVSLEVERVPG